MIGSKAGAPGAKRSRGQSTKRKRASTPDRGGVAGVSGSGDGGSGVSGESDGVADVKFIGVRGSPSIVEIKNYDMKKRNFYVTVNQGPLVAAIVHDVARLQKDPGRPEKDLNILKVERCMKREAQIVHSPIGKRFVLEFTEQHPLQLKEFPNERFPLKLEGLNDDQYGELKKQIVEQGCECFQELKKKITRDDHVAGRQRKDLDEIQPSLPEDDAQQEDDRIQEAKDLLAEVVAKFAPPNGKLPKENQDAKGEADKSALITFLKVQLQKLEPAQHQCDFCGLKDYKVLDDFEEATFAFSS